jgi:hypothetical protein
LEGFFESERKNVGSESGRKRWKKKKKASEDSSFSSAASLSFVLLRSSPPQILPLPPSGVPS